MNAISIPLKHFNNLHSLIFSSVKLPDRFNKMFLLKLLHLLRTATEVVRPEKYCNELNVQ